MVVKKWRTGNDWKMEPYTTGKMVVFGKSYLSIACYNLSSRQNITAPSLPTHLPAGCPVLRQAGRALISGSRGVFYEKDVLPGLIKDPYGSWVAVTPPAFAAAVADVA